MKCKECGIETGANWKTLCFTCYKKQQQKIKERKLYRAKIKEKRKLKRQMKSKRRKK